MRWRHAQTTRAENYVPVDVIVIGYAEASFTSAIEMAAVKIFGIERSRRIDANHK